MMKINVKELVGVRCIIKEDGQKVYDVIHSPLKNKEAVLLNFEGVTQFASPFFNFAIGQLLRDIKIEDVDNLLKFENITISGKQVIQKVIENAHKYYGNPNYGNAVDDILKRREEDAE